MKGDTLPAEAWKSKRSLFCKKAPQKIFLLRSRVVRAPAEQKPQSFLLLFVHKKKSLSAEFSDVAAPAGKRYTGAMQMKSFLPILPCAILSACQVPGRNSFAPPAVGADTQSVSATQAFAGRVALITILPGTTDFAAPVAAAVRQALAIKPAARFEVRAQSPAVATPDASAADLAALSGTAASVAKAIIADGVDASRVSLTAGSAGLDADILVFVK